MSYLDAVSKKMKLKDKLVEQNSKSTLENSRVNTLKTKSGQPESKPTYADPPLNRGKRKSMIRTVIRAGTDGTSKPVKNTNKRSPRYGKYYHIEAGKGGNYHVYKGGKRVFVRTKRNRSPVSYHSVDS